MSTTPDTIVFVQKSDTTRVLEFQSGVEEISIVGQGANQKVAVVKSIDGVTMDPVVVNETVDVKKERKLTAGRIQKLRDARAIIDDLIGADDSTEQETDVEKSKTTDAATPAATPATVDMTDIKKQLDEALTKLASELAEVKKQLTEAGERNAALASELAEVKKQFDTADVKKQKDDLLSALRSDITRLDQQAATSGSEVTEIKKRLETLETKPAPPKPSSEESIADVKKGAFPTLFGKPK